MCDEGIDTQASCNDDTCTCMQESIHVHVHTPLLHTIVHSAQQISSSCKLVVYVHFTTTYRFSCLQRVYKYYFPQGDMDLEASVCTQVTTTYKASCGTTHVMYRCILAHYPIHVQVMSQAAQKFVGEHDFRNFCKVRLGLLRYTYFEHFFISFYASKYLLSISSKCRPINMESFMYLQYLADIHVPWCFLFTCM